MKSAYSHSLGKALTSCLILFAIARVVAEEKSSSTLTNLGSATINGYVDTSASWRPGSRSGIQGMAVTYQPAGPSPEVFVPGRLWRMQPVITSFAVVAAGTRREVARVTTSADGRFEVSLRPGRYWLVADALDDGLTCYDTPEPIEMLVKGRHFKPVLVSYNWDCFIIPTSP